MKNQKSINLSEIDLLKYVNLDEEKVIVASGGKKNCNVMITNDVTFGIMRDKAIATIYLEPDFYTKGYIEKKSQFSINLMSLTKDNKEIFESLSSGSGRDEDKFKKSGLTLKMISDVPTVEEAQYVLICNVIYRNHLSKNDFFEDYKKFAKKEFKKDYDYAFVAEIVEVYEIVEEDSDTK